MTPSTGRFTHRALRVVCLAATLVAGCSDGPTSPFDVAMQRRAWEERRPFAYEVTVRRSCFCGHDATQRVRVEVLGGVVQRRYFVDSGADVPPGMEDAFPDIDALFEELLALARRKPHRLEVGYDERYGFPSTVQADVVARIADDEFFLQVTEFHETVVGMDARAGTATATSALPAHDRAH